MRAEIVHQPIETYSSVTTMKVEEKGLSLRGYMRILLIAVLIIPLSIASTMVSFFRSVSYGWCWPDVRGTPPEELQEITIIQRGFPYGYYSIIRHTVGGQLETEKFEFHSEAFIMDIVIYIITYSVIAAFILWRHRKGTHAYISNNLPLSMHT
jgi:hypothetical protein